jgi:hypothetical protein
LRRYTQFVYIMLCVIAHKDKIIMKKETRVHNFKELHTCLSRYRKNNVWIFRGQADPSWKLIPKAGRSPFNASDDNFFFRAWKRRAAELISDRNLDDWDWLTVAQDHGLPTRLLDWTGNPLAAAYFAVEPELPLDGVIYAYYNTEYLETNEIEDPFSTNGISRIFPRAVIPRLVRQHGLFTIHNPATAPLEDNLIKQAIIERIIIDKSYIRELKFELSHYGINRMSLFPDLDGLSAHIRWHLTNTSYWDGTEEMEDLD